jgi:hypothetical protein
MTSGEEQPIVCDPANGQPVNGYWCNQGLDITVDGPDGRFHATVQKPFARIGRRESSEVVLPDKRVPLQAIYLHATETEVFCIRLTSSVARTDRDSQARLAPGQTITVGPYQISVELSNGRADSGEADAEPDERDCTPPHPSLMLICQNKTVGYYSLRRKLTVVGRDQKSALRLADSQISASHCILYRQGDQLWAIDLFSSNGISIADQPTETTLVAPGQSLGLGDNVKLVYLPVPQAGDDIEQLSLRVTGRMIDSFQQPRRRLLLLLAGLLGLLVLLAASAVFFLGKDYLLDLWKQVLVLAGQEG